MGKGGACVASVPRVWHFCDSDIVSTNYLCCIYLVK